jgi:hypothetical protein
VGIENIPSLWIRVPSSTQEHNDASSMQAGLALPTNASHAWKRRAGRRLERIPVFQADEVLIPIVVCDRLPETNIDGIVKPKKHAQSEF